MIRRQNLRRTKRLERPAALALLPAFLLCFVYFPPGVASAQKKQPKQQPKSQPKEEPEDDLPEPLPLDEMMEKHLPTVKELLDREKENAQQDWVVMKTGFVFVVEPVSPRPNTLEKIEQRLEEAKKLPRPQTDEQRLEQARQRSELARLPVKLFGVGPEGENKIHYERIEKILHHEDLLLIRIGLLQDAGEFPQAFELLFNLKRAKPGWPSIPEMEKRQLLSEAASFAEQKQDSFALLKLEELHERDPGYADDGLPRLRDLFGETIDRLAAAAEKENDFRRARHYLGRLAKRYASHSVVTKWEDDFRGRAEKLERRSQDAASAGKHDEAARLVTQAVDVWPATPGLQAAFEARMNRFQQVRVGVLHLAGDSSPYFLPTLADERARFLTETPLFEARELDDVVLYDTQYFRDWTPTDLGRTTVFELAPQPPYWQPQPPATATEIADSLRARLNPKSRHYDERLTSYVQSVRVHSPTRLEIRFARVPPRLESVFRRPLVRPATTRSAVRAKGKEKQTQDGPGDDLASPRFSPYKPETWTDRRQVYRRHVPEPDGAPDNRYHAAEVEEIRFDSIHEAVQALKRGRVHALAHVPPYAAKLLRDDNRLQVRQYSVPTTHAIQFNPESKTLHDRELRRALAYALDRRAMLDRFALRTHEGGDPDDGRLVSAPFPRDSYAYGIVPDMKYDVTLALALSLTVRRSIQRAHEAALGGSMMLGFMERGEKSRWIPPLRMLVAPGDAPRRAAETSVKQWERIGVAVEIIRPGSTSKGDPLKWDLVYRTGKMIDPVVDLWPYLTFEQTARVEALKHLPDWLRQELIRVDLSPDWSSTVRGLHSLHSHLAKESLLIPLWEVDDYIVLRRDLGMFDGSQHRPVHTYQNIERWTLRSQYPQNYP